MGRNALGSCLMNLPDLRTQSWRGGALARLSAAIVMLALLFGLVIATSEEARAAKAKASLKDMCEKLLANTVIEKYEIELGT